MEFLFGLTEFEVTEVEVCRWQLEVQGHLCVCVCERERERDFLCKVVFRSLLRMPLTLYRARPRPSAVT